MTAMIIDSIGVRLAATPTDVRARATVGKFFWLDIFSGDDAARAGILGQLGLELSDITWAQRFGQTGRMLIGKNKLRAATWMAEPTGALIEVHLLCTHRCILTVWSGNATALDHVRQQFAERVGGVEENPFHAAGILLQLLLGTLDHAVRDLDLRLDDLRMSLDKDSSSADFATLTRKLQRLQSVTASFNRYSSAVRSSVVGIEAVPGMDERAADELNEYAEQVEDIEEQLYERRRWMSDMMHDYATAIAQRQGEQINRLTLVSLIFLPVTAWTGFFGMNFGWMTDAIGGAPAFFILGAFLPLLCVALTAFWLSRRGLVQLRWSRPAVRPPVGLPTPADLARQRLSREVKTG